MKTFVKVSVITSAITLGAVLGTLMIFQLAQVYLNPVSAEQVQLSPYDIGAPDAQELLDLTNEVRAKAGVAPLAYSPVMAENAQWKANDMVARGYWQHKLPGTDKVLDDVHLQASAQYCATNQENIYKNGYTTRHAVDGWMGSTTGHREAMLNPESDTVGFGITKQADDTYLVNAQFCIAK